MTEKITVIIPAYNVEKYLGRCLDSVLGQTYSDLDIIVINDGSTDGTLQIAEKYASEDDRIRVISQSNQGVSVARNKAISLTTTKYVTFVDSDDSIALDMISLLYEVLIQHSADISMCEFAINGDVSRNLLNDYKTKSYTRKEALDAILHNKIKSYNCGKLYKMMLFEGVKFPEGRVYEDLASIYLVFAKINKLVKVEAQKYYYFENKDSITGSFSEKKEKDAILAVLERYEYAEKNEAVFDINAFRLETIKELYLSIKRFVRISKMTEKDGQVAHLIIIIKQIIARIPTEKYSVNWKIRLLMSYPKIAIQYIKLTKRKQK